MKRAALRACGLAALLAVVSTGGWSCRSREEGASPVDPPQEHSKKSPSSSLPFLSVSFDEALDRARAEKKLVFVDVSADWCTWCTKMDEDVFVDPRVKEALLAFVPIKVDADRGGGRSVANRYRVEGLPAYLLLGADGEVVGRFDGYLPVDAFLLRLKAAAGSRG